MKKGITVLICLVLLLSICPVSAVAAADTVSIVFSDEIDVAPEISMEEYLIQIGSILPCVDAGKSKNADSSEHLIYTGKLLYEKVYANLYIENRYFDYDATKGQLRQNLEAQYNAEVSAKAPNMLLILNDLTPGAPVWSLPTVAGALRIDEKGRLTFIAGPDMLKKYNGKTLTTFKNDVAKAVKRNQSQLNKRIKAADAVVMMTVREAKSDSCVMQLNWIYKGKNLPLALTVPVVNRKKDEKMLLFLQYDRKKKSYAPMDGPSICAFGSYDYGYTLSQLSKREVQPFSVPELEAQYGKLLGYEHLDNAPMGTIDSLTYGVEEKAPTCEQTMLIFGWSKQYDEAGNAEVYASVYMHTYKFADAQAALDARDFLKRHLAFVEGDSQISVAPNEDGTIPEGYTPPPKDENVLTPYLIKGDTIIYISAIQNEMLKKLLNKTGRLYLEGYRPIYEL